MTSHQAIWTEFASFDNFQLAWQRTINATSRMVNDELGMKAFAYNLDANLRDLIRQVQATDFPYEPLADHKVYVPKPSTTLRTLSLMSVPDLIVYQALVNVVADHVHQLLVTHENQHVYGNLYSGVGKRWMLKPWKQQYDYYVNRISGLFYAGNTWIASTDIVAFYDTIDHKRLQDLVRRYCFDDDRFLTLFANCLSKWSAHNSSAAMSRGIPQGSNASDFLANLFLYDIDREMIVNGHHYVRYVDDIRILASDQSSVQRGLIRFDLELKRAGLVAQVSKTSVHQIKDIEKEINRLKFFITDQSGDGSYVLVSVSSPPKSEQAESVTDYIQETMSEQVDDGAEVTDTNDSFDLEDDLEEQTSPPAQSIDDNNTKNLQQQLREKFLEALPLLSNPDRSKEAESTVTFCLNRLDPDPSIRQQVIDSLDQLPWRSEAVNRCLSRFENDPIVAKALKVFIINHDVYSWHRANSLWALRQIDGGASAASICRDWLSNSQFDWQARTVAAKILAEIPGQHSFLMECLQREQEHKKDAPEETSVLRQQLAYGAFHRLRSPQKQLALLRLICKDKSPLVRRLVIYLLQQPKCKISWNDLTDYHKDLGELSEIVRTLGIDPNAPRPCLIAQTMTATYKVSFSSTEDLRLYYGTHYDNAINHLRASVSAFHQSPSAYVSAFHQYAHLSVIAFYEYVQPSDPGLYSDYAQLLDRAFVRSKLPRGNETWKRLGSMRNRAEHPVDRHTQSHSKKITVKEVEDLSKELQVSLQELFDAWLNTPKYSVPAAAVSPSSAEPAIGVNVVPTNTP